MRKNRETKINLVLKKSEGSFLKYKVFEVTHIYPDGSKGRSYNYELVSRRGTDSVVIVLFCIKKGEIFVGLKKNIRIPKVARKLKMKNESRPLGSFFLIEAIAGSLECSDKSLTKIKERARKEVLEEAGFEISTKDIISLGKPFFTSPGQSTEKIYPFAAKVDLSEQKVFSGDGSLLEKESGKTKFYSKSKALEMIRQGKIEDAKTEIAIIRLFMNLKVL
ncbi:MAG: hypothetical protein N2445_05235 [Acidobacteria bacterium]|nr:hypothetical protein [Acidobacteriota bacterium]